MSDKLLSFFETMVDISTLILIVFGLIILLFLSTVERPTKKVGDKNKVAGKYYWYLNIRIRYVIVLCQCTWQLFICTPNKKEAILILAGCAVGNFIPIDRSAILPADITIFLRLNIQQAVAEVKVKKL